MPSRTRLSNARDPSARADRAHRARNQEPVNQAELDAAAAALERTVSWVRRAVRPTEWSAVALSTMDALDREGPLRVTDLVARERITQPGMTGLVGRLAEAGLVERNADPHDGRVTLVTITSTGRDYLRSIREQRTALVAAHLRHLTPEEQQLLVNACTALQALSARPLHPEEV